MPVFAATIAAGDIIKYQSFANGSFVWGNHVRYNNLEYLMPVGAGLNIELNKIIKTYCLLVHKTLQ